MKRLLSKTSKQTLLNNTVANTLRSYRYTKAVEPEKYFNKVLIANRGEIACRVIDTCNRLGIETVAVYTDADKNSKYVKLATEAAYIGKDNVADTYNNIEKIISVMKERGADAVHPGYGFLSENREFAERVAEEGLTFVGPPTKAINAMGDKIESKAIAKGAGVSVIPGYDGEVDMETALREADIIGYPVMIKASAGGGGKGMRVAYNADELESGFKLAQSEAIRNFSNGAMLIEKFIEDPRHVEIQVLSDSHGNHIYLNERECSVQRRNQKVVEEAPCVVLDDETRKAMGEQACQLAKAVDYLTAGTVEMIIDKHKNFYFLEMNTRLQVEHPITEMITGVDLVEQMLRAASGKQLSFEQKDIGIEGWATECRVYAEDPLNNFAPSIGKIHNYVEPSPKNNTDERGVRCDSGILSKSEISVYFDPMICKLVTYAPTREESIDAMVEALDNYVIQGVTTNIELLRDVITKDSYRAGDLTTDYLPHTYPDGFKGIEYTTEQQQELAAMTAIIKFVNAQRVSSKPLNTFNYVAYLNEEDSLPVRVSTTSTSLKGERTYVCNFGEDNEIRVTTAWQPQDTIMGATFSNGSNRIMQIRAKDTHTFEVQFLGKVSHIDIYGAREASFKHLMPFYPPPDLSKMLIAPMPGSIIQVHVEEGEKVRAGQELVVMEAMKMQNVLRAPSDTVIKKISVTPGDLVANDDILIEFESVDE
mmetsp:Transcript_7457/g.11040  ORF Transcript_7457/g.11040 Transcript_7457/m.11040 type:complete len:707 (+) Transcript_7457:32-2152(+)